LPAGDDPGAVPRLIVVDEGGEQAAHLDHHGELATLLNGGAEAAAGPLAPKTVSGFCPSERPTPMNGSRA
jgi:hypothetical protein